MKTAFQCCMCCFPYVALGAAEIALALFEHTGEELQHDDSLNIFAQMLSLGEFLGL